jgi:hypothetical protein
MGRMAFTITKKYMNGYELGQMLKFKDIHLFFLYLRSIGNYKKKQN